MTLLSSFQYNLTKPKLDKIENEKMYKENQHNSLMKRTNTDFNKVPDMKKQMEQVRRNKTTFKQSFLNGTSSRTN